MFPFRWRLLLWSQRLKVRRSEAKLVENKMVVIVVAVLSLCVWLFLLLFWGDFWQAKQRVAGSLKLETYPSVWAIIPARDEAEASQCLGYYPRQR